MIRRCISLILLFVSASYVQAAFGTENDPAVAELRSQSPQIAKPDASDSASQVSTDEQSTGTTKLKLQGKAEVLQSRSGSLETWQAAQAYRQGVSALNANDYALAAKYFRQAGDKSALSTQEGKFTAACRFAEAQARRLMKDNAQAAELFKSAIALFREYDPKSAYLKDAVDYLNGLARTQKLHGKASQAQMKLRALPAIMDSVGRTVVLKGKVTELADGTKISALKDADFFNGGTRRLLPEAAAVDVSDAFVKKSVYKCFVDMNCLEMAALGGNLYSAPDLYKALKSAGKTVVIGASDEVWSPLLHLVINGRPHGIAMDLPGIDKYTHNVLLVTDGQHVLALDPRTNDTWKLTVSTNSKVADFSWSKLTHKK